MKFKDFSDLVSKINQDLGVEFCNRFQYTRKALTNAKRVAERDRIFGTVHDYVEDMGYAYAMNLGGTNELQYHISFNGTIIHYGLGFNTQYVPYRGFPLVDVQPFMEAFLALKEELKSLLEDYKFLAGSEEQLKNPKDEQYTLWGREIYVTSDEGFYIIGDTIYKEMLKELEGGQFEAYVRIFKHRNQRNRNVHNVRIEENNIDIDFLHDKLFLYLQQYRETHPDFYFLLRDSDVHERLEKGYWFWGNEEYLMFSCWKGVNKQTGGRIIGFEIEKDGTCTLRLSATDDAQKAKILAAMASILPDMKRLKSEGVEVDIWERRYESKDYLANIQGFIENDVPKITTILSLASPEIVAEFIPITANVFEKNIARIEIKRAQKQEKTLFDDTRPFYESHLLLEQLSLENIGVFSKLTLDFSPNVTVLIGENGIGKTTLLRAIALALAGVNENSLLDARHPKIQQLLHIQQEINKEIAYSDKGAIRLNYEYKDYAEGDKHCQNTILFSKDKFGIMVEDDTNSDFISVENDKFPHLVIGFSQVQNADIPLTVKQIPAEKLAAIKDAHIKDLLPLIYNQPDNRFEAFGNWIINLYNLGNQRLVENSTLNQVLEHQLIHFVFSIISKIIGTQIRFKSVKLAMGKDSQNLVWIHDEARGQDIPLQLISQGFNSIFGWVGYLMMRMYETEGEMLQFSDNPENPSPFLFNANSHAIVLIDEIDTYLHPKWQRKVLSVLVEAFPKVQFVVTTHSPLVLGTLNHKKAIAYRVQKDGAEKITHFYGTRIQDLIYQEYGIKERPAEEVQQKIDALYEAIESENKANYLPLYQELMEMLGENDPAMLDATFLMEERELI